MATFASHSSMLRLVLSARQRVGAVAVAPPARRVIAGSHDLLHRRFEAPRFLSSDHDTPQWQKKPLAVYNPVTWQEAVKPSLHTFLQQRKHLMVPVMFVVPHGDEAWPRAAWGYPLGKHAAWLRKQWREGAISPNKRVELDAMGFAWDFSQCKWDRFILPSLRTFYDLNGHTNVPVMFRVPRSSDWPEHLWDQPLGSYARGIRYEGDFAKQVRADQVELERLEFSSGVALSGRKRREKVVPELTVTGNAIPDKRLLEELGSGRNDPEWKWSKRIMPALETFRRLHGHCRVPVRFVVPQDERWPTLSWGLKIGSVVDTIRSRNTFSAQVSRDKDRLVEIGFVWDVYESEWSERIFPALEAFRRLNGHCRVPQKYVVPSDENWPRLSWGLNLGKVASKIRQGGWFAQVARSKTRLDELGFVWDVAESDWSERIMPALETFRRLHGHCRVPVSCIVPSEEKWPAQAWGMSLGLTVRYIRQGSYAAQVARSKSHLEALGFVWDFFGSEWSERIMPALETFRRLYGHCRVPATFEVPADAAWPEESHGHKLGSLVRNIRSRGSYFDQIARTMDALKAIEFDSKRPVTRKWEERVEPMLATFEQLHGHRDVPHDFVVPSSPPWEEKDWGIQLGKLEREEPLGLEG